MYVRLAPLFLLLILDPQDPLRDQALAERVATSVNLFTLYTGHWPNSLEDLTDKPEGGFWYGVLPKEAQWKNGTVTCGKASVRVAPPTRRAIVPPTQRLREFYSARIRLQLVQARVAAYVREFGRLPTDAGELPPGVSVVPLKDSFRIRVDHPAIRENQLTEAEKKALEEGARLSLTETERREIHAWIDRISDDDFEPRDEASKKLLALGPYVREFLLERVPKTEDPEVRERIQKLVDSIPAVPPAWRTELRGLTVVMLLQGAVEDGDCMNNLSRLWELQSNYMVQFGGPQKQMPPDLGKEFWLKLSTPPTVLIDVSLRSIYVCPLSGKEPKFAECDYYGPASDVNGYTDGDPVGMCDYEGHGYQVVLLLKSGEIRMVSAGDSLRDLAARKLKR